jgi:hypothetical protein
MLLRRTLGEEPAKVQPQPEQPLQPSQPSDDDTKDSLHLDTEELVEHGAGSTVACCRRSQPAKRSRSRNNTSNIGNRSR